MTETKNATTRRVGRPSREDLGKPPTKFVGAKIEIDVLAVIYEKFDSIGHALRFAAAHGDAPEKAA